MFFWLTTAGKGNQGENHLQIISDFEVRTAGLTPVHLQLTVNRNHSYVKQGSHPHTPAPPHQPHARLPPHPCSEPHTLQNPETQQPRGAQTFPFSRLFYWSGTHPPGSTLLIAFPWCGPWAPSCHCHTLPSAIFLCASNSALGQAP